ESFQYVRDSSLRTSRFYAMRQTISVLPGPSRGCSPVFISAGYLNPKKIPNFLFKSSWPPFYIVLGCFCYVTPHSQFVLVRRRAMPTVTREIREQLLTYDEELQKLAQKHAEY